MKATVAAAPPPINKPKRIANNFFMIITSCVFPLFALNLTWIKHTEGSSIYVKKSGDFRQENRRIMANITLCDNIEKINAV